MEIGINVTGTCKSQLTGTGYFALEVIDALDALEPDGSNLDQYHYYCRLSRWRKRRLAHIPAGKKLRWFQEPCLLPRRSLDVIHTFGSNIPRFSRPANVCTLFDVFSLLEGGDNWTDDEFRRLKAKRYQNMADYCDVIIAASGATKRDFLRFIDYPAERIHVVHGGVSPRFSPAHRDQREAVNKYLGTDAPYLLFLGMISPRKNLDNIILAYAKSAAKADYRLVIAGKVGTGGTELQEEVSKLGLSERVIFPGYAPDALTPGLYACAAGFLFPTHYEGFGMPILEAMVSNVPVVTSDCGSAPEVAGDHGVIVAPKDVDAIAVGIDRALEFTPAQRDAAREYASGFTWGRCAQATRDVYQIAVNSRKN